jgi:hypothetical protein
MSEGQFDSATGGRGDASGGSSVIPVVLAWLAVGIPMAWGVWMTLKKALLLFR